MVSIRRDLASSSLLLDQRNVSLVERDGAATTGRVET
jgi:hypothetical protein